MVNAPILDFHEGIMDALTSALPVPPPPDAPGEFWNAVYQRVSALDWAL
ncbi:hypothetical protein Msi02_18710 [Microbispora siamensis]|uniref:Uncharacterized protein n=1 Tax=Microbispora siamensis TaxID=564413 RepID=A0ABQ4GHY6_9ACTN|nr:hypothetical protein Msi02_18710 [Microbispora siamensis]